MGKVGVFDWKLDKCSEGWYKKQEIHHSKFKNTLNNEIPTGKTYFKNMNQQRIVLLVIIFHF